MSKGSLAQRTIDDLRLRHGTPDPSKIAELDMTYIPALEKLVLQEIERREEQEAIVNQQLRLQTHASGESRTVHSRGPFVLDQGRHACA